jgi:hypothetical protein
MKIKQMTKWILSTILVTYSCSYAAAVQNSSISENLDGSTTIENPRIIRAKNQYQISYYDIHGYETGSIVVCRLFGFDTVVEVSTGFSYSAASQGPVNAQLAANGDIERFVYGTYITQITCSHGKLPPVVCSGDACYQGDKISVAIP